MIEKINVIRNVGKFNNCSGCPPLKPLTLISANNGKGKTTITAIFRSLSNNKPETILERKRLGTTNEPEIRITVNGNQLLFQNSNWNNSFDDIIVFDDDFIEKNVYSGLSVTRDQRIGLHEIILGTQNVQLVEEIEEIVGKISKSRTSIRDVENNIQSYRGRFSLDDFINLPPIDDVDHKISEQENLLQQNKQSVPIQAQALFQNITLIEVASSDIINILSSSLVEVDQKAIDKVKQHFATLGYSGEQWIRSGIKITEDKTECPFCGQNISDNSLFDAYRNYFSEEYEKHINNITTTTTTILEQINRNISLLKRFPATVKASHTFWQQYIKELPNVPDGVKLIDSLIELKELLEPLFKAKGQSPLKAIHCSEKVKTAVFTCLEIMAVYQKSYSELLQMNTDIKAVKEKSQTSSIQPITNEILRLKTVKVRHSNVVSNLIADFNAEKEKKEKLERQLTIKRELLDHQQKSMFPQFESTVNNYLSKFSADFQIANVNSDNRGGTPSVRYGLKVNNIDAPVDAFKNTLSAGDRSTLALAYFFAILENTSNLHEMVIVLDDPFTSMDKHRAHATVQEIRTLKTKCKQLIALSHDREFLWRIQNKFSRQQQQEELTCLEVVRDGDWSCSTLRLWDISQVEKTVYDECHYKLREYCRKAVGDPKDIAPLLRMIMEGFCRVAFTEHFPPGKLLGEFRYDEMNRQKNGQRIMYEHNLKEICEITDYANKFHHLSHSNYSLEIQNVNEIELKAYAERVLNFTKN